ncbi:hypothetical protein Tco_1388530 [Tanacetum coccineum]
MVPTSIFSTPPPPYYLIPLPLSKKHRIKLLMKMLKRLCSTIRIKALLLETVLGYKRNSQAQGPIAPIGGLRSCFVQSRTYRWSDDETFGAIDVC